MNNKTKKVIIILSVIAVLITIIGSVSFYRYLKESVPPNYIDTETVVLYG